MLSAQDSALSLKALLDDAQSILRKAFVVTEQRGSVYRVKMNLMSLMMPIQSDCDLIARLMKFVAHDQSNSLEIEFTGEAETVLVTSMDAETHGVARSRL